MQWTSAASAASLPGFGVLLQRELMEARRSKRIVIFLLVVTAALVLIPVIGYFQIEHFGDGSRHTVAPHGIDQMLGAWIALVGYLGSLMAIASTLDAVAHDRSSGISAWIVTKPVSRLSYLLAKATAHAMIAALTIVVIPTMIWLGLTLVLFSGVPAVHVYVAAAVLCVEMAVLTFVTIALGVPLRTVTPIAIAALALWFLPNLVPAVRSLNWTYHVLPSYLPLAALSIAIDETGTPTYTIPFASLAIAAAAFIAAVVWFERQEL